MRRAHVTNARKGWLVGPWDSGLAISLGYATEGVDEPHLHITVTEIYLVARGSSSLRVEGETIELTVGDAVIVEPGKAHTFLSSSDDYLHFVVHSPGLAGDDARREKQLVPRSRLGL
jgi:mannose-6-phosphate isomerase-like protein (cupin superfamily)